MTDTEDQNPVRRSVVVTAILLVAAAVVLVVLRPSFENTDGASSNPDASMVAERTQLSRTQEPNRFVAVESSARAAVIPPSAVASVEPLRVVLLPGHAEAFHPAALQVVNAVRQATLRELRAMAGVEVVELNGADPRYKADIVAEISEGLYSDDELWWWISMQLRRPEVAGTSDVVFYTANGLFWKGTTPAALETDCLGVRYAATVVRVGTRNDVWPVALKAANADTGSFEECDDG